MPVRLVIVLPALVLILVFNGSAAQVDQQTRADVEKYLASLKAAYDSGDRAKVFSHFQHGDLITPSEGEYAMLGQLGFWEKPR